MDKSWSMEARRGSEEHEDADQVPLNPRECRVVNGSNLL